MSSAKFRAEISDFKVVYNILKAILFREYGVMHPMEEGLKVTVEEMKSIETSVYIPAEIFTSYHIDPNEDVKFKISLKMFTECLNIFGDDNCPSLKLTYRSFGQPLCLVLKHNEENVTVDCELQTMDVDDFDEIGFPDECTVNKIVVNADILVNVLTDLDQFSDDFHFHLSPNPPYCRIKTSSIMGESGIDISRNSDMVTIFECKETTTFQYASTNIRQILKVMSYASQVSISTNDTGLLGLQLVINNSEKQIYVEYYVSALFDVE